MGLNILTMKKLGLFDNISYKYIKDVIHDDIENNRYPVALEVAIEELINPNNISRNYCKTEFKFCIPQMDDESHGKKFSVIKEYKKDEHNEMIKLINSIDDEED